MSLAPMLHIARSPCLSVTLEVDVGSVRRKPARIGTCCALPELEARGDSPAGTVR